MPWTIFNREGRRKYLTSNEIDRFVQSARAQSTDIYIFCCMMAFTGCRISEALSLTRESVDFEAKAVIVKSLKKRGKMIYRAIPLPPKFLTTLARWLKSDVSDDDRLWPWSRMTGYRRICEVMRDAGVKGGHAMPKGLRHGFGVRAIQASVPLNLVQKWLGHADIKTTAIYTSAMGPEERAIASRMWGRNQAHGGIIEDTCSPPERVPPSACDTNSTVMPHGRLADLPAGKNRALGSDASIDGQSVRPPVKAVFAKDAILPSDTILAILSSLKGGS
ncbi:tyrosine-type recombinase/integrase [Sphingobium cupriresistens]|uniref:Site-specific integrase n=1 Tax=Sphingobium cupriresistens TaxID=1132417 RepID=A0A8G1ZC95_9SPHN|nr:site-specific integrase [Sphingobium cupriresistens]RYM05608.1 site-specific integrase [Sphingobium cupriresistens]